METSLKVLTAGEAADLWQARAACRLADPNLFFHPEGKGTPDYYQKALAYCQRCPVAEECLGFAEANGLEFGVWGGKVREMLRRRSFGGCPVPLGVVRRRHPAGF